MEQRRRRATLRRSPRLEPAQKARVRQWMISGLRVQAGYQSFETENGRAR